MNTTSQTPVKAKLQSSFTPVRGKLLQRKCACGGTHGPTGECEARRKKRDASALQRAASHTAVVNTVPHIVHEVLRSPGAPLDAATRDFMEPRFSQDFSRLPVHSRSLPDIQAKLTINDPRDIYEQEADRIAEDVMRMPPGTQSFLHPNPAIVNEVGAEAGLIQRDAESPDEQGDCSGWEKDCDSFCRRAARQYWLDVGTAPLAIDRVECKQPLIDPEDGKRLPGLCFILYKNGVMLQVAPRLSGGQRIQVWQTKSGKYSGQVCYYRYYCTKRQNTLVLVKEECYNPPGYTPSEAAPEKPQQESNPLSKIQRSPTDQSGDLKVPLKVQDVLNSPGQALDPGARAFMGKRFGRDFSRVRVHADAQAAESARQMAARAYTLGNHIVFGEGQFDLSGSQGQRLLAHELAHVVQQTSAQAAPSHLQRELDKKQTRQDVVLLGEDMKNGEELARLLSPSGRIFRVKSVGEVAAVLSKIDFPIGTLYFVAHSAPNGAVQFSSKEGVIDPANIAGKLKSKVSADNAPEAVDFRGCSVGSSPKAMNQIRAALGAKSVVAGTCFSIIERSTPILLGDKDPKPVTKKSDVTPKNRKTFKRLLKSTAEKLLEKKKCILNISEDGFFAAGGQFVALWFNPTESTEWIPGKSICYNEIAPETVDPNKALSESQHCRLIRVETTTKSKD